MIETGKTLLANLAEHGAKIIIAALMAGMLWVHTTIINHSQRLGAIERRVDAELRTEIGLVLRRSDENDQRQESRIAAVEITTRAAEVALATNAARYDSILESVRRIERVLTARTIPGGLGP